MRYHLILVRMAIIKKMITNECWRGFREKGSFVYCCWDYNLGQPVWKKIWTVLKKSQIELPYDLLLHTWVFFQRT